MGQERDFMTEDVSVPCSIIIHKTMSIHQISSDYQIVRDINDFGQQNDNVFPNVFREEPALIK